MSAGCDDAYQAKFFTGINIKIALIANDVGLPTRKIKLSYGYMALVAVELQLLVPTRAVGAFSMSRRAGPYRRVFGRIVSGLHFVVAKSDVMSILERIQIPDDCAPGEAAVYEQQAHCTYDQIRQ